MSWELPVELDRPSGYWRVLRFGGRVTDTWRTVLATDDEAKARKKYEALAAALRQGRIVLQRPDGTKAASGWGPTLRTRW